MKQTSIFMKMGAMALAVGVVLTGCSHDDLPEVSDHCRIRLGAGLSSVTRSVIGPQSTFTAAVGGWESASGADYSSAAAWLSTADVAASGTAVLTLSPERYYSQNGSVKTCMKAWYPAGSAAAGRVDFSGDAEYAGDGTDDVLLASEVVGSALDAGLKTLAFNHLTSQIKFALTCDELFEATGTKLLAITLKDVGLPAGIDLQTDALIGRTVAALPVGGIDGDLVISQQSAAVGDPVMIVPFAGNKFYIDVQTSDVTYRNVEVTLSDALPVAGKAYTVTLDFKSFELTAQATVAEWDYSGTGSATVEGE